MSLNRANDTSQSAKVLTYLGITLTFQIFGFISSFVYSSYFNRTSTFAQSFLFPSSDEPPVPLGFRKPLPFGNHFFGDYLWIYAEIKNNGLGGYFGASQLFLLIATKLPYYLSLIGLLSTALLFLLIAARLLLRDLAIPQQLALVTGGFLLTQPVLLAIDRGQIHFLLFAVLLLGLTLSIKDDGSGTWGAILIAAAISMKLTPVFFLLLFVRKGCWRELKIGIVSLIGFLLLPVAYLYSGIGAWKFVLGLSDINKFQQQMYNSVEYFTGNVAYNNSFKVLAYHFSHMESSLGKICSFIYGNYFWCAGFLFIFLCWLIIQKNITQFESVLLMAIGSSLLIPIASGYTLTMFIMPIAVVLADKDFVFNRSNTIYCCYTAIMLMPKQFALGFGIFEDSTMTLGGILNPSFSMIAIIIIAGKSIFSRTKFLGSIRQGETESS